MAIGPATLQIRFVELRLLTAATCWIWICTSIGFELKCVDAELSFYLIWVRNYWGCRSGCIVCLFDESCLMCIFPFYPYVACVPTSCFLCSLGPWILFGLFSGPVSSFSCWEWFFVLDHSQNVFGCLGLGLAQYQWIQ